MNIFIRQDQSEIGPFTRDEVFARLREGAASAKDEARTEDSTEWKPLMEVLSKSQAKTLFTIEKIEALQEEAPPPPRIVLEQPSRRPQRREPEEEAQWDGRKVLTLGAAGMAAAFVISVFWFQRDHDKDSHPSSALARTAPVTSPPATPAPEPALAAITPPPATPLVAMATPSPFEPNDAVSPVRSMRPPVVATPTPPPALLASATEPMAAPAPATGGPAATPKVAPPVYVARQVWLPIIPEIEQSNVWVADTATKPGAALVLIVDPKDKPESFARNKDWQAFAHLHNFGLAVVSFTPKIPKDKKPNVPVLLPGADEGLGALLLLGVDGAWAKALPLVVYGRYGGGRFATSFAQWKPERLLLWTAYGNEWKDSLPKKGAPPVPALIVCDREGAQHSTEAHDFYSLGRALERPWTWLCLNTPWKERPAQLDQFFRDYTHVVLTGDRDPKNVVWANIETLKVMSKLDRMAAPPTDAVWLPDAKLTTSWTALMPKTQVASAAKILQRSVATRNPKQPTLEMYLRLPAGDSDKPIAGVLAFCTWEKDHAAILSKLDIQATDKPVDLPGPASLVRNIVRYAEDHRMAVLTWGTAEAWNNKVSTEEMEKEKQKEFDRSFDLLANAWEHGLKELCHEAGDIPTDNMLLYGMSRGAQWAHRLAIRKPDHFLAVHVHIPSTFDTPTPEANKPLWLVTTGELEYGYEKAKAFYSECRTLNYPIMFKAIVGIGHEGSPIADALGIKFFDYALSVKAQREEQERQKKDSLVRLAKQTAGPWLKAFREPEFFGDFVNQDCYPVAQADMIPTTFRVPLPTKILADAWNH